MRYLSFILLAITFSAAAQDTSHLRISLLTCSPGEELYSTFGHSALRIIDSTKNEDSVYNYGTFNFEEPGFYTRFIRGKLHYYLSSDDFNSFRDSYIAEKRGMTEQVLALDGSQKMRIKELITQNMLPENRGYKYDFLFDNCTTRLRDLVEKASDSTVTNSLVVKEKTTYRNLIHVYLDQNDKQWSKFGIDLLLGSRTDAYMNKSQVMFLPDYLMKSFDSSIITPSKPVIATRALVLSKAQAYPISMPVVKTNFLTTPLFIFSVILVVIVLLSFSRNERVQRIVASLDGLVFFVVGLAGLLILFMWFGTEHLMCSDNYNIIWALPTHAIAAFFMHSRKKWVRTYLRATAVINILLLLCWFVLPQELNVSFLPIILLLIFRSIADLPQRHKGTKGH